MEHLFRLQFCDIDEQDFQAILIEQQQCISNDCVISKGMNGGILNLYKCSAEF